MVQTMWDSIADDTEISPISDEHKMILDERLKAHSDNPNDIVGWDEVKEAAKKVL